MRVRCRLREFRGKRPLRELGDQAQISAGILSMIERGHTLPMDSQIEPLEKAYGRPVADWYNWRGPTLPVESDSDEEAA